MSLKTQRKKGKTLTRVAAWRAREALDLSTGELVDEQRLADRVKYLTEICAGLARPIVTEQWSMKGVQAMLTPGLPSFAYRALERVRGRVVAPEGLYVPSRVIWMAEEIAGRTLRASGYQIDILQALVDEVGLPEKCDPVTLRNARRALRNWQRANPGQVPKDAFTVRAQAPWLERANLPLAVCDRQHAAIAVEGDVTVLTVRLPIVAAPVSMKDWVWHELRLPIPKHTQARLVAGGRLCLPTLKHQAGRVMLDVPVEFEAPKLTGKPKRVLALDWGERRLLTASVVEVAADGSMREIAGPFVYDARQAQARMQRQREHAKHLHTKQARVGQLIESRPDAHLEGLVAQWEIERVRLWEARSDLQVALAHHAARWAVELAQVEGCDTIGIEDLRSMEPKLRGAHLRDRLNHQVRGVLFAHLSDKAAETGLRLTTVNPRGTSKHCPRCGADHKHVKAPNEIENGRGWALCGSCDSSLDRDHAASLNIGARALSRDLEAESTPPVARRPRQPRRSRTAPVFSSRSSRSCPEGVISHAAVAVATSARSRHRGAHHTGQQDQLARTLPAPGLTLVRTSQRAESTS